MTPHTPHHIQLAVIALCAALTASTAHAQTPPGTRAPPATPNTGLSAEVIQRAVRDATPRIRRCYERHGHLLKPGALPELAFTIQADGSVSDVTMKQGGEPVPKPLAACLRTAFGLMVFPPVEGGGVVRVRYPGT